MTNTTTDSNNDPIGKAISDYFRTGIDIDIEVLSEYADPDVLPASYLFRTWDEMPKIERKAIEHCTGRILDIGAGAGAHSLLLKERGFSVDAIDTSPLAVETMQMRGIHAEQIDFFHHGDRKYDTLLLLMNGIGIAEDLQNMDQFFTQARSLLSPNGRIICDSTDIRYLYEEEDGSMWVDLNGSYYGELLFQMRYGDHSSSWFKWLYIDEVLLQEAAARNGFSFEVLEREDDQYLAVLKMI